MQAAVRVGEDLDLDVAGADHGLLEDQLTGTEGARRFRARRGECGGQLFLGWHETHAAPAASGRGLDHHRKADALGLARQRGVGLVAALVARHTWHAGLQHAPLGGCLVAHGGDGVGRWADEDESCLGAGTREVGVLRQEAVARMDGVGAEALGGGDDRGCVQVARARFRRPDAGGDVGGAHVQGVRVGVGIDRGRAVAHGLRRAHDPAAISPRLAIRMVRNSVIPGLACPRRRPRVPGIQASTSAGAGSMLAPGDKRRDWRYVRALSLQDFQGILRFCRLFGFHSSARILHSWLHNERGT